MLHATHRHYGGSAEKYSDMIMVLDFGPQAGGPACLGAHVFYLSAFHIASARYGAGFRCYRKVNTQN